MKKKKIGIIALATLLTVGVAACDSTNNNGGNNNGGNNGGSNSTENLGYNAYYKAYTSKNNDSSTGVDWLDELTVSTPDYSNLDTTDVYVYLNYGGKNGVSLQESQFVNTINGRTYVKGDILPTFTALGNDTKTNIVDVASYSAKKDDESYKALKAKNYVGENNEIVDLFYNTTSNIKKMGSAGEAVDLVPYIKAGKMPYFTKYLQENPEVLDQIMVDGHIYYTPYYDGYQEPERMLNMDTEMVKRMVNGTGDSTTAIGENRLGSINYQPFMDD